MVSAVVVDIVDFVVGVVSILGAGRSLTTAQGPPRKLRLAKSVSVSVPMGEAQDDERRPGRRRIAADLIWLWAGTTGQGK
jgi:hypothetical protein